MNMVRAHFSLDNINTFTLTWYLNLTTCVNNLHYEKFQDGTVKCIEDEIPFEVPEGWSWARVRDIAMVKGGKRLPKGASFSEEITTHAYIRVTDMKNHSVNISNLRYISDEIFLAIKNYTIAKDDLYVTIAGTIGVVGEIPDKLDGMNLTENAVKITNIAINKSFLCIILQTDFVQQQFQDKTHQVAMPKLALERILSTLIPICPYVQQLQIVDRFQVCDNFLSTIDTEKEELQKIVSLSKSKILDLAIRGKLVPQDLNDEPASVLIERIRAEKEELIKQGKIKRNKKESVIFKGDDNSYYEKIGDKIENIDDQIPFDLPQGWLWCRGYSCFEGMESTKPQGEYFDYIDIDAIDNRNHCIKESKHLPVENAPSRAIRAVRKGSVLFSLVRPYLENIAIVDEKHSNCIASTGFYICNSNGVLLPEFMFFLMISGYVVNGLNQFMKGDNSPSISKGNIENWLYPVPPANEQEAICNKLNTFSAIIVNIEKSLN